jgi:copper(I)-binding protein
VAAPELPRIHRTGARVAALPRRARQAGKDDPPVIRLAAAAPLRPRAVLLIGAVVGSVALGGCAAGQVAQTAYQANSATGATVTANGVAIRDAQIVFSATPKGAAVYPTGGAAPIEMHVINQSNQDDKLVSATSPVAASVQISGQSDLPAGVAMVVGPETGTGGQSAPGASQPPAQPPLDATLAPATPGATAVRPSSAQEPSDTSPTGSSNASGEAPPGGLQPPPPIAGVIPSTRYAQVVLTGLREDIKAGLSYEIDLTFERAGQVRVMLPVAFPEEPRERSEQGG